VEFGKIILENFMSYQLQEFSDIGTPGLTLIEGENLDEGDSNGSGKSAMWDGIAWALFGQTIRGLKHDDVIRRGHTDCLVIVEVTCKGRLLSIVRYRKHRVFGDRLRIMVDGKIVEKGTVSLTQDWLLGELDIDFDLFRCTVLFGQGDTFNFVDSGSKAQKEILSKVMRVNFDEKKSNAASKVKTLEAEKNEISSKILVLESHLEEDPHEVWRLKISDWDAANREKIESISEKLVKNIAEYRKLENRLEDLPSLRDLSTLEKAEKEAFSTLKSVRKEEAAAWADYDLAKRQLENLGGLSSECPTCYQSIDADELSKTIAAAKICVSDTEKFHAKKAKAGKDADWDHTDKRDALDKARKNSALSKEIESQLASIKSVLVSGKARLAEAKEEKNPFKGMLSEAIEKRKKIVLKKSELEKQSDEIEEKIPYYLFWQNAFGDEGIKSFIFDLICGALTSRTNKYLSILAGGFVSVSFDTQKKLKSGGLREKFDCMVKIGETQIPYAAFSGGEKTRISLSVDMALSDLMSDFYGEKFNIVVFDEQDTYLDPAGRKSYMRLLRDLAKSKRVFVVAHDAEFKSHFDDVWTIQKKDGVSRRVA